MTGRDGQDRRSRRGAARRALPAMLLGAGGLIAGCQAGHGSTPRLQTKADAGARQSGSQAGPEAAPAETPTATEQPTAQLWASPGLPVYPMESLEAWENPPESDADEWSRTRGLPAPRGESVRLDAGTTNLTRVTHAEEGADFDPDISRDGTRVVFASTQHRPTADIYIKDVDGRTVTQLTNDPAHDVMPKLSPDGQRIAFASDRAGSWNIYVMPATGGQAVQITADRAHDLHPSWSPDGTRLVFCRLGEVSRRWELWVTSADGNGTASYLGVGMFPEWCPVPGTGVDGADRIVFQRSRERGGRTFGVWTLDVSGEQAGNFTEIAADPRGACINPCWSTDGRWIVYAAVPGAGAWSSLPGARPPHSSLWMTSVDGKERVAVVSGPASNLMPAWGPDGTIYFVCDRSGRDNVWAADAGPAILAATGAARGAIGAAPDARGTTTNSGTSAGTSNDTDVAQVPEGSGPGENR